ncbi:hypothetical protein TNCV_3035201 [Trichonephila clavipes]|nr:hypothetical protein TNCV_3035201 [Trichonephila clavipes]
MLSEGRPPSVSKRRIPEGHRPSTQLEWAKDWTISLSFPYDASHASFASIGNEKKMENIRYNTFSNPHYVVWITAETRFYFLLQKTYFIFYFQSALSLLFSPPYFPFVFTFLVAENVVTFWRVFVFILYGIYQVL